MQGFSEALRAELDKDGIDVLVVCPGLTQTNFSQNMLEQKARVQLDPPARHDRREKTNWRREGDLNPRGPERPQANWYP